MAKKEWIFELEDGQHTVELEHSYFSGKRVIRVDGNLLESSTKVQHALIDTGSEHKFNIGTHPCVVTISSNGITFKYDLIIDGRSVTTGQPAAASQPLPGWSWAFIIACGLIPVVALGGAIPAVLGIGGAFACTAIARNKSKSTGTRIALCVGVTVLVWILFGVMLVTINFPKA